MSIHHQGTPPVPPQRARVLIIDDDPRFRSLLSAALREEYIVFVAADGTDGFHQALDYPPDIAIIDIQVSGWDGLKALRAFRAHEQFAKTGIVVLTSDASRETVMAAIEAGAHEYIIKSAFSREDFLRRLENVLSRIRGDSGSQRSRPSEIQHDGLRTEAVSPPHLSAGELEARQIQDIIDSWEWHDM